MKVRAATPYRKATSPQRIILKWRTWAERVQIFDDIVNSLSAVVNGDNLCLKAGRFGDVIRIGARIGAPSRYGEAFQAYLVGKRYKLALKKVMLLPDDRGVSYTKDQLESGVSAWSELAAYMLASLLVMAKVCNNLPFTHKYTLCDHCRFVNKDIRETKGNPYQPCALVINEYAEGDLFSYLEKRGKWTLALAENCAFQIAVGLYAMEKYFRGMSHNDLHDGNVLVHEIKPGGYWKYKIDGLHYYVENLGYVFVLWDFGMVHIPKLIRSGARNKHGRTDIGHISESIVDALPKILNHGPGKHSIIHELIRLQGKNTAPLNEIIRTLFATFRHKPRVAALMLDHFNMDTSIAHLREAAPSVLRPFFTNARDFAKLSKGGNSRHFW